MRASPVRCHRDMEATQMKNTRRTKLRVDRDVLRVLQAHELHQADGGGGTIERQPQTGDSRNVCCA